MLYISPRAGEEIVDTQHLVAILKQFVTKMRSKKSRAARYKNAFLS